MKCQFLFSGKKQEKYLICCLLKILPRALSIKKKKKKKNPKLNVDNQGQDQLVHTRSVITVCICVQSDQGLCYTLNILHAG